MKCFKCLQIFQKYIKLHVEVSKEAGVCVWGGRSKPALGPFSRRHSSLHQKPSLEVLDIHKVEKADPSHPWEI